MDTLKKPPSSIKGQKRCNYSVSAEKQTDTQTKSRTDNNRSSNRAARSGDQQITTIEPAVSLLICSIIAVFTFALYSSSSSTIRHIIADIHAANDDVCRLS